MPRPIVRAPGFGSGATVWPGLDADHLAPRWRAGRGLVIVPRQVQRGQRREQERDRQHDPEVEQVDEAVERVAGAILAVAGAWG